jgi:TPR repeat protein
MSTPLDRTVGPEKPSPYAPKWIRDAAGEAKRKTASTASGTFAEDNLSPPVAPRAAVPDEEVVIERYRLPRSLEPTLLPEPRSLTGVLARLMLATAVAASIAFIVVGKPWTNGVTKSSDESNSFSPRFVGQTSTTPERPSRPAPKLIASQAARRGPGEAFPLGASIRGPGDDTLVVIAGLVNGATLSAGRPAGDNVWRLSAADLNSVMIQPPRDFVGAMDLTIELRLADDTLADRRSLRFEWAGAAVPEAKPKAFAIHQLDPDEIGTLLKRGDELIASGDLAAARLVLQRAAEAGDARAALALAGTYDPIMLEKLAVHGFAPNIAMARDWYEKAKQFGSADAPRRLEMLASRRD